MKRRLLLVVSGLVAVALVAVGLWLTLSHKTIAYRYSIPKGFKLVQCEGTGECQTPPKKPLCASEKYSMCINGVCSFVPRAPEESADCQCYREQVVGCLVTATDCGRSSGIAVCDVTDDYHSKWNPTCWNLAK